MVDGSRMGDAFSSPTAKTKKQYKIKGSMKKTIPVVGMACSACSANVERKLNSLEGISSASVNLAGRSALVDFDPTQISLEQMKKERGIE